MTRAIIAFAVLLALAVASNLSSPRGSDLRDGTTTSEVTMAKKTPSAPDASTTEGPIDRHVAEMIGSLAEISEMAKERPGPVMTAVHDVALALIDVLYRAALFGEEDTQTKFQPTHAAVLKYMSKPGVPPANALIIGTPREFREQLLRIVPLCFNGPRELPLTMVCDIVAFAIMKGRSVNAEVSKLTMEDVKANLLRNLAARPVPARGKPEEVLEAVLKAAGLPANTVDNIVDGGQRMKKKREAKRKT